MKRIFIIGAVIFLASCGANEVLFEYDKKPLLEGLASGIQLQEHETEVLLTDYFVHVSAIDSIYAPPPFDVFWEKDGETLRLVPNGEIPWLSELKIWSKKACYSILMRRSRKTALDIAYFPKGTTPKIVQLKGQMNDWDPSKTNLVLNNGTWSTTLRLNPGKYQYQFVVDGQGILDPANPIVVENGIGGFNSLLEVGGTDLAKRPLLYVSESKGKTITLGQNNPTDELFVFWENYRLGERFVQTNGNQITIVIPANANGIKRSHIRVWAYNAQGEGNDLLIPLEGRRAVNSTSQLVRSDLPAQIMYSLMVDRFYNASKENDAPVNDPEILPKVNYYGGDILGITKKIRDGFFNNLGISTIWVSPITQNPLGAYGQYPNPKTKFSGYHGYWPISSSQVDFRFGTSEELTEMLDVAHEYGLNVILDYVANHVHQEHPLYREHPDWATSLYLPDGTMNTERWDDHRLTTWFDTFMPTLDLENPEVYEPMTDSALFWVTNYNFDGFRHDATKHIPEVFWRLLTTKVKENVKDRTIFQIGETYGSHDLISSYIGSGMLNSQFDFNIYDAAIAAFAKPNEPFTNLNAKLIEGFAFYGWNNLMGIITGNHDKSRFISLAGGALSFDEDGKQAGWTRTIGVRDTIGYKRLQMLLAFNLTIPGVPTIYQGDEFGQPGANDPDNRKMMQFDGFSELEQKNLDVTKELTHLRRSHMALNYGTFEPLLVTSTAYAYIRTYMDDMVLVAFNKATDGAEIELELPSRFAEKTLKAHFGNHLVHDNGKISLKMNGENFEVVTVH